MWHTPCLQYLMRHTYSDHTVADADFTSINQLLKCVIVTKWRVYTEQEITTSLILYYKVWVDSWTLKGFHRPPASKSAQIVKSQEVRGFEVCMETKTESTRKRQLILYCSRSHVIQQWDEQYKAYCMGFQSIFMPMTCQTCWRFVHPIPVYV